MKIKFLPTHFYLLYVFNEVGKSFMKPFYQEHNNMTDLRIAKGDT